MPLFNYSTYIIEKFSAYGISSSAKFKYMAPMHKDVVTAPFCDMVRAECLNTAWFMSRDDARSKCETWRRDYNEERPHSAIGDKCPIELMNGVGPYGPPDA